MPAVDLLNELANLFHVTVDEILKGGDKWPVFSYEKSGVDVAKIDLINQDLKTLFNQYSYNPAFRGAIYDLNDHLFSQKSLQIVSKVQEPVTKQKIAMEYGYIQELVEDIICTCINDLLMIGAQPLFLTETLIMGHLNKEILESIIRAFNIFSKKYDIKLLTGQCSIKSQSLQLNDCLISTTITGILDKSKEIDTSYITEGDIILAIESNGLHHYGYSLIDTLISTIPEIKKEVINGHYFIEEIMKPQYCYYESLIDLIDKKRVKGLVNISGCGFPRNLTRVIPQGLCTNIDLAKIKIPPIFHCLKKYLKVSDQEMLNTFNCGVGYIVIVDVNKQEEVLNHINQYFPCKAIGIIQRGQKKIKLRNSLNWNEY